MTGASPFPPTYAAALSRLQNFVPHAGAGYARLRNYDLPEQGHPHVSSLSPYLRHRLLTEEDVLQAVLGRHSLRAAEKFVQEVYWRTYWKGWLELRPSVWLAYKAGLAQALDRVHTEAGLRMAWEEACRGETEIEAFNAWARELVETGYLHNHARMWFASIWIFTLRLPWELGADFFLRHLLDGDAASNTLSWRWVAGLQTQGKNYVARAANISKYTEGRHRPLHQLAVDPAPLSGPPHPPRIDPPQPQHWQPEERTGLLLTEDDLSPSYLFGQGLKPAAVTVLNATDGRSPLHVSAPVHAFVDGAISDTLSRYADSFGSDVPVCSEVCEIARWAKERDLAQLVVPYTPVGPAADRLAALKTIAPGLRVVQVLRAYDHAAWPNAKAGFFKFKEKIPTLIGALRGLKAAQ
ncbi:MAG: FAD-binding domain-containing protein [Dinoroseobacter sp.]|nr:FAD-binding domain-containing protein [Dinoroseobacter sp.]